jgi:starvation-inducible DNA-binding protein
MIEPFVKDLKEDTRAVIHLLNARLADAIDLTLAVKQARWNIQGRSFILQNELPSFIALHELLDQIAGRLDEHGDSMAERVVKIAGLAAGTVQAVMKATSLPSYPANATAQADHLNALRDRFATFAKSCRAIIDEAVTGGDASTADIMTGISQSCASRRAMDQSNSSLVGGQGQ